jgi:hypothetical protein
MRYALLLVGLIFVAGCQADIRLQDGDKHADGPGRSEHAPGQQKKK